MLRNADGGGVGCDRFVTKSVTRFTVIVLCGGPISRKNVYVIVEWPLNVSIVYTDPLFVTYITTSLHYLSYCLLLASGQYYVV